jgi:CMD domain protein
MTAPTTTRDVVNAILGVDESSPVAALRNQKPSLVREAQEYYDSLFSPTRESAEQLPVADRAVVAIRVASHTGSSQVAAWFDAIAREEGVEPATIARATDVGDFWSDESRLAAAIRHADLLVTAPSEATPSDLEALKRAGYSPAAIVALSQTIAFVTYQVRLVAGLRALAASQSQEGQS